MIVASAVAALVGVLGLATVLGLVLRSRTGRARTVPLPPPLRTTGAAGTHTRSARASASDIAAPEAFGTRATLVQFSTPTCARCPATRRQLDAVAAEHPGVRRIEIDLAEQPHLATRFNVMQTPTVLLLDAEHTVRTRFGGPPRPPELAAALETVLESR